MLHNTASLVKKNSGIIVIAGMIADHTGIAGEGIPLDQGAIDRLLCPSAGQRRRATWLRSGKGQGANPSPAPLFFPPVPRLHKR